MTIEMHRDASSRTVDALFDPASVAVLGASNDETKYGNWIAVQALRGAPERPLHLVNRRGEPVLGRPTHRRLAEVPTPVDLVVIAVPAAGFEEAVDDALAVGARAIVAITAGFAELGEQGRAREAAVAQRVREAGAVLLGPNCLGVLDTTSRLYLASNPLPAGNIALLSQSGNMALELSKLLQDRDLGFSRFASLGNQADIGVADLIRSCTAHSRTDAIAVYCEDFRDGREFVDAAAGAVAAGKPVVLLTVGGSAASVRGARSHTGALTTDMAVIDAACRAAGVDRVASVREMADLLTALHAFGPAPAGRVAVFADGGGHAALGSDIAASNDLEVPEFGPGLREALRAELTPSAGVGNPIDLAGAGEQDITSFARTLDLVLTDPGTDAVLMTGYFGGYGDYGPSLAAAELATATELARIIHAHGKPVAVHTMCAASAPAEELRRHGIPVFREVDPAARTLGLLARHPQRTPTPPALPAPATPQQGDGYWESRELLRTSGLDFPAARLVRSPAEARAAADELGYPVVVKALGLLHKSDCGGVALNLADAAAVESAVTDMTERLQPPGFCVEAMADRTDGVELIVGVQRDPRFGPVAMIGLGGVFTEVLHDVAFALAPLDAAAARELLARLRAAALLGGVRGRPPVDIDAIARAVAVITRVAAEHPEIAELEVNPLLATPGGAVGLDARIVLG